MAKDIGSRYKENFNEQVEESERLESSDALAKAQAKLGEEEGKAFYDKTENEVRAKEILANKRILYGSGIEKHNKEVERLGEEGVSLSKEYKNKKEAISNNADLTKQGKGNKIEELYQDYNARAKALIEKQRKLIIDHDKEYSEIAKKTLKEIEESASIRDFSETDMQYILYMLQHANNEFLLDMLEEYDFNPFLLRMVNARDSKLPSITGAMGSAIRNPKKLMIEHPLKSLTGRTSFVAGGLQTKIGQRELYELIPIKDVPSRDHWAQTENVDPFWRR